MEPGHLPLRRGAVCEVDLVDASVIQRGIRSDSDFSLGAIGCVLAYCDGESCIRRMGYSAPRRYVGCRT
ncbi:hypothetical protein KB20921_34620 [Edwardsiella ictaluri]|nr:Uncharacterised protein [Edwardsiella ictaluri]BEI00726.1 hypothetical protein KH20906_34530 [Edwardsiella ictaluri]BEI04201.1 hypothetical protein KB20921_34620 [Edwardsiella ictaluri]BEI07656.1 hypothetical protein KH201010_34420 [Edwardsiella ictaluri]BEI11128.1 hypothetical protein STU22726_34590 [Edwardsiella ictaluri]